MPSSPAFHAERRRNKYINTTRPKRCKVQGCLKTRVYTNRKSKYCSTHKDYKTKQKVRELKYNANTAVFDDEQAEVEHDATEEYNEIMADLDARKAARRASSAPPPADVAPSSTPSSITSSAPTGQSSVARAAAGLAFAGGIAAASALLAPVAAPIATGTALALPSAPALVPALAPWLPNVAGSLLAAASLRYFSKG